MIDRALIFIRDQVNEHMARVSGAGDAGLEDAVVFPAGDKLDPLTLKVGAVNLLLVNVDQELVMRPPDPFVRMTGDGATRPVQPPLRLNLMLLFAARYVVYEAGLAALSQVLRFFQANRVFGKADYPDLDARIDRLAVELRTLAIKEQNDLWASLKLAYHPALMFRVGLLTVEQDSVAAPAAPVTAPRRELAHADPAGA